MIPDLVNGTNLRGIWWKFLSKIEWEFTCLLDLLIGGWHFVLAEFGEQRNFISNYRYKQLYVDLI